MSKGTGHLRRVRFEDKTQRMAHFGSAVLEIDVKQGSGNNVHRQLHHRFMQIDDHFLTLCMPSGEETLSVAAHDRRIAHQMLAVKCWLSQTPLTQPECSLARHQAIVNVQIR
jgi:hypothetical protein